MINYQCCIHFSPYLQGPIHVKL